jgi:prepilin signal peptidase PulO-like enzyme (type II secretory pathway)
VTAWLGLSAFLLGQRTSPEDGSKLSWRYPITELGTATLMVIAYYAAQAENVSTLQTAFWLIYMAVFVLITVIDIEHKLILFVVIVPSCVLAILDAILTSFQPTLVDALIGGAAGFLVFFLMYNGGYLFTYVIGKLRGREIREVAFGYGDVMMATLSGLILGWRALIFAMFITVFLGAFGALIYMFSRRFIGRRYSAFTAIPYGPYIVAGTILMLLYRVEVRQAIFGW